MTRFLVKKLLVMALTMVVISFILFGLLESSKETLPRKVLGPYISQEQADLWLEANGYMRPFSVRYLEWLGNALQGEFGDSIRFKTPVADVLWPRLANTAILGGVAMGIIIPLSLTLGMLAGMKEGSLLDRVISMFSIITTSVPEFASSVFMVSLFVFWLSWLPGTSAMSEGFSWAEIALPVLVLVLYDFGYVSRMTRASMVEVMTRAYIRTAVLKGLPHTRVILRHALRNALIAPFTVIMLQINWLLSGVIVVEFFFGYKGFGSLLVEAALNQDILLIIGCALISVFVAVTTQILADIGYVYLNPRIRFS